MVTVQVGRDFSVYWATGSKIHGLCAHYFASGQAIGFVSNLSYTIEQNVDKYHGLGKREPWGIKEGAYDATAHLEGLWVDSGAQKFFIRQSKATGALTVFAIGCSGSDVGVAFSGCRVGTFDSELTNDGWATETIDIPAIKIL